MKNENRNEAHYFIMHKVFVKKMKLWAEMGGFGPVKKYSFYSYKPLVLQYSNKASPNTGLDFCQWEKLRKCDNQNHWFLIKDNK